MDPRLFKVRLRKAKKSQFPGFRSAISGHRYYNPSMGRFLGRDPAEEKGGLHLYAFCENNAVNRWDYLGMDGSGGGLTIKYIVDTPGAFYSVNGVTMSHGQTGHYSITSNGTGHDIGVTDMSAYQNMPITNDGGTDETDGGVTEGMPSTAAPSNDSDGFDRLFAGGDAQSLADKSAISNSGGGHVRAGIVTILPIKDLGTVGDPGNGGSQTNTPSTSDNYAPTLAQMQQWAAESAAADQYYSSRNPQSVFNAVRENMQQSGTGTTLQAWVKIGNSVPIVAAGLAGAPVIVATTAPYVIAGTVAAGSPVGQRVIQAGEDFINSAYGAPGWAPSPAGLTGGIYGAYPFDDAAWNQR